IFRQHVVFRNVGPERVGSALLRLREGFLKIQLPFTGEKPVDEYFCRVRMRRLIDERQKSLPRAERGAFLHQPEGIDRQTLLPAALGALAPEADGEFSRREPVEPLAPVAKDRELGFRQQPPEKVRPELRAVIEKTNRAAAGARRADVAHLDLALPLGIQEIAERRELLRIDELRVVVRLTELRGADVAE